jgi:hypothetical protein
VGFTLVITTGYPPLSLWHETGNDLLFASAAGKTKALCILTMFRAAIALGAKYYA